MSGFDFWISLWQTVTGNRDEIPSSTELDEFRKTVIRYQVAAQDRRNQEEEAARLHPPMVEEWEVPDLKRMDEEVDAWATDWCYHGEVRHG